MGKKKHRSRRTKKAADDSESSEEESHLEGTVNVCPHASKAVNFSNVKKVLKDATLHHCQQCDDSTVVDDKTCDEIWMCLYCGNQGCGRYSDGKHSLLHYQIPHSDTHSLAVGLTSLVLWCYDCDSDIACGGNKKLIECVEYIKKNVSQGDTTPKSAAENISNNENPVLPPNSIVNGETIKEQNEPIRKNSKNEVLTKVVAKPNIDHCEVKENPKFENSPKIKGLINLGNTCFLNSVLQSLAQTNILFEILSSRETNGISATIGDPSCDNDTASHSHNEKLPSSMEIVLPESGPLSHTFCLFYKEYAGKVRTINPGQLLGQICKRAPQFRGALQHDSHELLRHLLDGLKSEEIKRYQAGILKAFGLGEKSNPKTVDEKTKTAVKAYGRCIPSTLVDEIFSGQLISTVLCEECGMSSQVFEAFLDLSLPVTEEKVNRPVAGKKTMNESDIVDNKLSEKPSKHQEKKSKKQAKRNAKMQRNRMKQDKKCVSNKVESKADSGEEHVDHEKLDDRKESLDSNTKDSNSKEDSETSDADVEDNAESGSTCSQNHMNEPAPAIVAGKELPNDEETWNSNENSKTVSSNHEDLCDQLSAMALNDEKPALRINGLQDENSDEIEVDCEADPSPENENGNTEPVQKMGVVGRIGWMSKSLTTLAPRYQPASQECSIYSCLNQFTAPELLTGPNKFGCENCTRLRKEKDISSMDSDDKAGKKNSMVYTNASKQLLIFSPPAILTLHLKRFQQVGYSLRKVNRHVEFPLILDLAPFCSSICLGLPTLNRNQHQVMYYLYAVVEHSGRLTGGHYTAYVRTSPKDEKLYSFLNLKPVVQADLNKLIDEMQTKLCSCEEMTKCSNYENGCNLPHDINSSRWYHISDSCISEVSESTVLRCQAYLLFYRRII